MKFARNDKPNFMTGDLADQVRRSVALVMSLIEKEGIELKLMLPDQPLYCQMNPDQIHEVISNLIQNAIYAMRRSQTKIVTVSLVELEERARLTVADTGPGIPAEVKEHLFEPFITTKPIGEGTGLGLSICHGIIKSHRGSISIANDVAVGTSFIIEIPMAVSLKLAS